MNWRETLRPRRDQLSNCVRAADRKRHASQLRQRHSREKRCAWLLATPPVNFTSMDAESIGSRLQRHELRLGPFIKIVRKKDDIGICTVDLRIFAGLESGYFLQLCRRPDEHRHVIA